MRSVLEKLLRPLSAEDAMLAVTSETSPPKWHLAHTTWFFEKFVLESACPSRPLYDPAFDFLFNSYYQSAGNRIEKEDRRFISRPSLDEVLAYRLQIDEEIFGLLANADDRELARIAPRIELGLQHEQQHQELFLMDVKRNFYENPTHPAYPLCHAEDEDEPLSAAGFEGAEWIAFSEGITGIGAKASAGFAFDNELPRHRVFLEPFELASAPVTQGEYLKFIEAGGYRDPRWWLSDGWDVVRREGWTAPLYWDRESDVWNVDTLFGNVPLAKNEPVSHLSYYEAQAYAKWKGCRLPTEAEWERAAASTPVTGQFFEGRRYHPRSLARGAGLQAMHGTLWEWTQSAYLPYPGYAAPEGALGEYNGKFMCNTMVLRGGSFATPLDHYRPSYRNFYAPAARWQFSGLRLARSPS